MPKLYSCSGCSYSNDIKIHVEKHTTKQKKCGEDLKILESELLLKCDKCDKSYASYRSLKLHQNKSCSVLKINEIEALKKQLQEAINQQIDKNQPKQPNNQKIYCCSGCNYEDYDINHVNRHLEKLKKCCDNPTLKTKMVSSLVCEYCDKELSSDKSLKRHYKVCKDIKNIEAKTKLTPIREAINQKIYCCSGCNYTNEIYQHVERHINKIKKCNDGVLTINEKNKDPIICEHCNKVYSSLTSLKEHHTKSCKKIDKTIKLETKVVKNTEKTQNEAKNIIKSPIPEQIPRPISESIPANHIYILREREFINAKQNVYKLGFTAKGILNRTKGYPTGSEVHICAPVTGNPESKLIKHFKTLYIHRHDLGNEYFEGNILDMFDELSNIIKACRQ